jgi:hypothetical protein
VTSELVAIILNRGSLQRFQCDHDELARGLGLEIGKLLLECSLGRRVENSGVVDDAAR